MSHTHVVDPSLIHHNWDRALPPVLTISSGDVVQTELLMAGDGQVTETSRAAEVPWDFDTMYNLIGPIAVEGAVPGDTLEIEILELTPGDRGWTAIIPELGLLPADFTEPYLKIWDLRNGATTQLCDGVTVPFRPFLGTIGVAPDAPGPIAPFPPHAGGGNMDNRHLVAGSTLWLPVLCEHGLLSFGDPHAAQGDGEVCVSAIECGMSASLRVTLRKRSSSCPSFRVPAGAQAPVTDYHGTMGISPDLFEGAQLAVRGMVEWIVGEHGLSREDAYVLCSIVGDLHVHELVDAGVWNVGMSLSLDVFR
ncbi:MAG: acetamidase/formamidase family protein [Gaiellales bacterium]